MNPRTLDRICDTKPHWMSWRTATRITNTAATTLGILTGGTAALAVLATIRWISA